MRPLGPAGVALTLLGCGGTDGGDGPADGGDDVPPAPASFAALPSTTGCVDQVVLVWEPVAGLDGHELQGRVGSADQVEMSGWAGGKGCCGGRRGRLVPSDPARGHRTPARAASRSRAPAPEVSPRRPGPGRG
jgi:hypothetical protein